MALYLVIKTIEAKDIDDARRREKAARIIWIGERTYTPPAQLDSAIGTPVTDHEALAELGFKTRPKRSR
jgi:hypothetical protein